MFYTVYIRRRRGTSATEGIHVCYGTRCPSMSIHEVGLYSEPAYSSHIQETVAEKKKKTVSLPLKLYH